ncbi:hypothetical protein PODOV050v2_p0002 [Vibrio phage 66E30.1]|uniref:Uncharacterized protein n=1 Tax=Shewanella phage X14 TaxID=2576871 RepID=A0A4P8NE48_9CAUD|nr:hypothetical protein [Staphylococcus aureus]YP_010676993.1 hypothetical protein PQD72_gp29 [Shewanella phage X14]QZI87767.1 hypothetical protein PODOV001v2_p0002 [Vibrio phage 41E34.2]QZI91433.1 hypothetical protein PODOV048v2_p0002 [Vibrio phage 34E29.1]QZI91470.1 hypothetical protein PODOV007v2_p0002 [Vibrio phage 36E38.1]QZI91739.1 hypothetical protein PODOV008v2_p0002 [Vibrio phage 44E38.1]QZI91776.1 hypothetical protein PODOV046v2_p0002 [Vibrio phage 44E38.2]QZI92005.1 hypothetical p
MRSYGEIAEVCFQRKGWNIYNLATEYKIWDGYRNKSVYVNTMLELKEEISKFIKEEYHEES